MKRQVAIQADSGTFEQRYERAMADATRRWRTKLAAIPVGIGIIGGVAWLQGGFDLATLGIPVAILVSGVLHLLKGPKTQVRSEVVESVMDVLSKKMPVESLLRADLPSSERVAHLRSVSDTLEDPNTFLGRHTRVLGPIVAGFAVLFWGGLGIASLAFESPVSAALAFAMALGFLVAGVIGVHRDRYRYEILRMIEEELDRGDGFGHVDQMGRASG